MSPQAEMLQDRTLLTAQVLLLGSELQILTDADEDVTVQEDPGNAGFVQVLIDSSVASSQPTVSGASLTQITIETGDSENTIDVSGVTAAVFPNLTSISIVSGNGDDVITGSDDFADSIDAGDGDDTITGQGGDSIVGPGGGDTILAGDGDDVVNAGTGDDSIDAGDGNDIINGDEDDDTILGGDGLDTLSGNDGNDSLFGGQGNDSLAGNAGTDFLQGDVGDDTIAAGSEDDTVFGGGGADVIDGGDGADSLFGNGGRDTIDGGTGDDMVDAGTSADQIIGGQGNDNLNGGLSGDTIEGGSGDDSVYGGSGNDTLFGDGQSIGAAGNDLVLGQGGADTITGGLGSDTLDGGAGNDLVQSGDVPPAGDIMITIGDASLAEGADPAATVFGGPSNAPQVGGGHARVVAADFDNDGDLDLASESSVTFNNGDGTFANPVAITTGSTGFMDVGDFDGDGFVDIVAPTGSGDINIILNNGDGTFAAPTTFSFSTSIFGSSVVHAGDFDQDGDVDVAAAIGFGVPQVFVLSNDGNADFSSSTGFTTVTGGGISDIESGDLDGDGDLDLFATKNFFQSSVEVLRNSGNGLFVSSSAVDMGVGPETVEVADLDGDGDVDIAVSGTQGLTPVISVAINNGGGFSNGTITTGLGTNVFDKDIQIADFDLDGDNDLLVVESDKNLQLYANDGLGNFPASFQFTDPAGATSVINDGIVGDFNSDGAPDLAVARTGGSTSLAVWINQGLFATSVNVPVQLSAASTDTVTVDFNTLDGLATAGSDYIPASGTVTFLPGETLQNITVGVRGDAIPEGDEDFVVNLSNPQNAVISDGQGSVVILEDDGGAAGPSLTVSGMSVAEGDVGSTTLDFTVALSAAPTGSVMVEFATADGTALAGSDYTATSGQLSFDAMNLTQTVSVTVAADILNEGNETFILNLFNANGAPILSSRATGTILDDDSGQAILVPHDTLTGGQGNDTLLASIGNDLLVGDLGDDNLDGGDGNDTLFGGGGHDTLNGANGEDSLFGQGGHDVVEGGNGNDELIWRGEGDGNDTLDGGANGNSGIVRGDSGADIFAIGQDVNGNLTVTEGSFSVTFLNSANVNVNGNNGNDTVTVGDISSAGLFALTVNGGSGDDVINASAGSLISTKMTLNGGTGQDTITGSSAGETINGDDDDDSLLGGGGNDTISGGDGDDSMNGDAGDDVVDGGAGNDIVNGGTGNDSLIGGSDQDTLDGQDGDDTLLGGFGDDNLLGNRGNDSLLGGLGLDTLIGAAGNDTLDGGRNDDVLLGNSGNDKLRGNHGNDRLVGRNGDDELNGGDGDDTIIAGDGNDGINGGDGNDFLQGDLGEDLIVGGDGDDNVVGGGGNDTLLGQQGDDSLNGSAGTDKGDSGEGNNAPENSVEDIDLNFELTSDLLDLIDGV